MHLQALSALALIGLRSLVQWLLVRLWCRLGFGAGMILGFTVVHLFVLWLLGLLLLNPLRWH